MELSKKAEIWTDDSTIEMDVMSSIVNESFNFLDTTIENRKTPIIDILITNNFINTVNELFVLDYKTSNEVNAIALSRFQLKVTPGIEKIVINWKTCCELPREYLVSILIHEISHCIDFQYIDNINNEFNISLYPYLEQNDNFCKYLFNFFLARSEYRAFYFDETYLIRRNLFTNNISQEQQLYMEDSDRNRNFIFPRIIGKLKCWTETGTHPEKIEEVSKYIDQVPKSLSDWIVNVSNSFHFEHFLSLSNQIRSFF